MRLLDESLYHSVRYRYVSNFTAIASGNTPLLDICMGPASLCEVHEWIDELIERV
jgi:hypothetical protein